jgi:hypothetical protein
MDSPTPPSDPLASVRHLIDRAEAAKRDARRAIRETRDVLVAAARIRATLPPEDRRPLPVAFVSFHPEPV